MMDFINDLHEMCGTLWKELRKANEKIKISGGKLTAADLDYVDKLTHAIKSVKTTLAMEGAIDEKASRRRSELTEKILSLMEEAPDDETRQELQHLADRMER